MKLIADPINSCFLKFLVLINNYQWSEWIEFEKRTDQRCGTSTYLRYYNLRIVKVIGNIEKNPLPTRCPATVQYKHIWQRACKLLIIAIQQFCT